MKALTFLAILVLAFVATFAFAVSGLRPDSEVTTHLFTDEQFIRARPICAAIGAAASLLALYLVWWLWRHRTRSV
jgi:hypothetical protein